MCTAEYKFDIYEKEFVYICDCTSSKTYFKESDTDYFALGKEVNAWSCADEVIQVDTVKNECYKGQYTLVFDPDRYWCGSIPLVIHEFDVINWPGKDTGVYFVDLFNMICKQEDTATGMIKPF